MEAWLYAIILVGGFAISVIFFICICRWYRRKYPNGMQHGMPQITMVVHQNKNREEGADKAQPNNTYNPYNPQIPAEHQNYNQGMPFSHPQNAYLNQGRQYP